VRERRRKKFEERNNFKDEGERKRILCQTSTQCKCGFERRPGRRKKRRREEEKKRRRKEEKKKRRKEEEQQREKQNAPFGNQVPDIFDRQSDPLQVSLLSRLAGSAAS
jgi:hypothetical protein